MTEIYFVIYYQSKNHKRYKIKKLLYKITGKCQIKAPRRTKNQEIEYALFNCTGEIGMDNFWLSKLLIFFILFLFCNEPAKKNQ